LGEAANAADSCSGGEWEAGCDHDRDLVDEDYVDCGIADQESEAPAAETRRSPRVGESISHACSRPYGLFLTAARSWIYNSRDKKRSGRDDRQRPYGAAPADGGNECGAER
jgi:hypothetical protein